MLNSELGFELKRDLNSITIIAIGDKLIEVQLFYEESCNSFSKITKTLPVTELLIFKIPFEDGIYKIKITSTDVITEEFKYKEFIFKNYNNLLNSIIDSSINHLCGCPCTDCVECNEDKSGSETLLKILSFYILNREYYSFFLNSALNCVECDVLQKINCILLQDFTTGKNNNKELYDSIIGYFYYIFYIGEKSIYNCCTEQVDEKFGIDKVLSCLYKKNIDIKCIEDSILTHPDFYVSDYNFIEL
mgnify:CR=1 FL=1